MKRRTRHAMAQRLQIMKRRARFSELYLEGNSLRGCESILRSEGFTGCDHSTLVQDLKQERQRLAELTSATIAQQRDKILEKLTSLETFVRARGWEDPNYVTDLLAIIDRLARLLGLNAADRVNVSVAPTEPEKMAMYQRFVHETRWIPEAAFDAIWEFCRSLSQPPTAESSARFLPPPDEDEEPAPKLIIEGDPEWEHDAYQFTFPRTWWGTYE